MIYNFIKKTKPIIVHCPIYDEHNGNILFEEIIKKIYRSKKTSKKKYSNLEIITWNNSNKKSLLEISLEKFNIYPIILGKNEKTWSNLKKIQLTKDFLAQTNADYIIGVDAFDAVFLKHPNLVLDIFLKKNTSIIFNATIGNWPPFKELRDLEEKKFDQYSLNSGAWVGEKESLKYFFELMLSNNVEKKCKKILFKNNNKNKKYDESEQLRAKIALEYLNKEYKIDINTDFDIFQIINENLEKYKHIWTIKNMPQI